ncbi:unnamed protein product [Dicrocoelium dendriticum]|nr:unnamed protein product [Dicrocoelium dendriticum]
MDGPTFIDSFRYLNPRTKESFTCWSTRTGARATNYGTRIDYILVDSRLVDGFDENLSLKVDHMTDLEGSDHCPIRAHIPLTLTANPSYPYPSSCSRFWPQCQSKQINLNPFVVPITPSTVKVSDTNDNTHFPESRNPIKKRRLKQATLVGLLSCRKHENRDIDNPDSTPSSLILDGIREREATALLQITFQADAEMASKTVSAWQSLLCGPKKAPLCRGHMEPCLLRTVKQSSTASGSRRGRRFWVCARPQGAKNNPAARFGSSLQHTGVLLFFHLTRHLRPVAFSSATSTSSNPHKIIVYYCSFCFRCLL